MQSLDPPRGKASDMYDGTAAMLRLGLLRALMAKNKLDALVLIAGADSKFSPEHSRAIGYLLSGASGAELRDYVMPDEFDDTFVILREDDIIIFTTPNATESITRNTLSWPKCEVVCPPSTVWQEEVEDFERLKVETFQKAFSSTAGRRRVGFPEASQCEKFPLVQAYALDAATGMSRNVPFFSMLHDVVEVDTQLCQVFAELDVQTAMFLTQVPRGLLAFHWMNMLKNLDGSPEAAYDPSAADGIFENMTTYYQYGAMGCEASLANANVSAPCIKSNQKDGFFSFSMQDPQAPLLCARTYFTPHSNKDESVLEAYLRLLALFDQEVGNWISQALGSGLTVASSREGEGYAVHVPPSGWKVTVRAVDFSPFVMTRRGDPLPGIGNALMPSVLFHVSARSTTDDAMCYGDTIFRVSDDTRVNLTASLLRVDCWAKAVPSRDAEEGLLTQTEWTCADGVFFSTPSLGYTKHIPVQQRCHGARLYPHKAGLEVREPRRGVSRWDLKDITKMTLCSGGAAVLTSTVYVELNDSILLSFEPSSDSHKEFLGDVLPAWQKELVRIHGDSFTLNEVDKWGAYKPFIAHADANRYVPSIPIGMQKLYRELSEKLVMKIVELSERMRAAASHAGTPAPVNKCNITAHIVSGIPGTNTRMAVEALCRLFPGAKVVQQDLDDGLYLNAAVYQRKVVEAVGGQLNKGGELVLVAPGYTDIVTMYTFVEKLGMRVESSTTVVNADIFFAPFQDKGSKLVSHGVLSQCTRGFVHAVLITSTPYSKDVMDDVREVLVAASPSASVVFDTKAFVETLRERNQLAARERVEERLLSRAALGSGTKKSGEDANDVVQHTLQFPVLPLSKYAVTSAMQSLHDAFPGMIRWQGWLHIDGQTVHVTAVSGRPLLNEYKVVADDEVLVQEQKFRFMGIGLAAASLSAFVHTQLSARDSIIARVWETSRRPRVIREALLPCDVAAFMRSVYVNSIPLPEGWRHDTSSYVNDAGKRRETRPDADALVDAYIKRLNSGEETTVYALPSSSS